MKVVISTDNKTVSVSADWITAHVAVPPMISPAQALRAEARFHAKKAAALNEAAGMLSAQPNTKEIHANT